MLRSGATAGYGEATPARMNFRSGYPAGEWYTPAGTAGLAGTPLSAWPAAF